MNLGHPDPGSTVEVVGAGPAGLAAAITLARAGRRVVVHEAQRRVGHRFAPADLQGLENWSARGDVLAGLAAAGLPTGFEHRPFRDGLAFDAWDRPYPLTSENPMVYVVERGPGPHSLDATLLAEALALGVEMRFGSRVPAPSGAGILATGPRQADVIAAGYHFATAMDDGFWLVLDDRLAPQGYAYLLVMNGRGTVKSCMFADFGRQRDYVARTVERFRRLVGLEMRAPQFHAGAGNIHLPASALAGGHLRAGECAGFQDGLAGFGMRYALRSGVMAARALLEAAPYDPLWRGELAGAMAASIVNRALFAKLGNRGYRWLLRAQAASGDTVAFLRWLYQPGRAWLALLPWARRRYRSRLERLHRGPRLPGGLGPEVGLIRLNPTPRRGNLE